MAESNQKPTPDPGLFLQAISIVLRGSFNPTIFHPTWFVHEGLIRPDEGKEAETEIVHQQVSSISAKWFRLQVTKDRFNASTTHEHQFDALRDLVVGTFRILHHTPVTAMGINYEVHYKMPSEEAWHAIGDKVAPKGPWTQIVSRPGLLSLLMKTERTDELKGYINVRVEPSVKAQPGVFVEVNDHYELKAGDEEVQSADRMLSLIENVWRSSLDRSSSITRSILAIS